MARVVPTVTAYTPAEYSQQLAVASSLSNRISIDFMDGVFTAKKNLNLVQAHWEPKLEIDLHLMYQDPVVQLETLIAMKPNLVVLHAEAHGDLSAIFEQLSDLGIKTGLAFLPETSVTHCNSLLHRVNHALIFSGHLGAFGGKADLGLLSKAGQLRAINPKLEIGWDGGVNDENILRLSEAGVEVLNVGGFIQNSKNPQQAFASLESNLVQGVGSGQ